VFSHDIERSRSTDLSRPRIRHSMSPQNLPVSCRSRSIWIARTVTTRMTRAAGKIYSATDHSSRWSQLRITLWQAQYAEHAARVNGECFLERAGIDVAGDSVASTTRSLQEKAPPKRG